MNRLRVKSGAGSGITPHRGCVVLLFYRRGTSFYPCHVALYAARYPAYLRSLVQFMQNKVPHP